MSKTKNHFVKAKTPEDRKRQQSAIIGYYVNKKKNNNKKKEIKIITIKK